MNASFLLAAKPGFAGIILQKESEDWKQEFATLEQAITYARSVATTDGRILVLNTAGKEVAAIELKGLT